MVGVENIGFEAVGDLTDQCLAKGGFAEGVIEKETKAIFPVIGLEWLDVVVKEACNNIEVGGFTGLDM